MNDLIPRHEAELDTASAVMREMKQMAWAVAILSGLCSFLLSGWLGGIASAALCFWYVPRDSKKRYARAMQRAEEIHNLEMANSR